MVGTILLQGLTCHAILLSGTLDHQKDVSIEFLRVGRGVCFVGLQYGCSKLPKIATVASLRTYVLPANHRILRVEPRGFEPLASAVQRRRSPN
jgi:hypothetical protein